MPVGVCSDMPKNGKGLILFGFSSLSSFLTLVDILSLFSPLLSTRETPITTATLHRAQHIAFELITTAYAMFKIIIESNLYCLNIPPLLHLNYH